MSVSASDGAEKLSALAEELSGNDPELGAQMLLLAAAALAKSRATYLERLLRGGARGLRDHPQTCRLNSRWRPGLWAVLRASRLLPRLWSTFPRGCRPLLAGMTSPASRPFCGLPSRRS